MYDFLIAWLVQALETFIKDMFQGLEAVIGNPPNILLLITALSYSGYAFLSQQDMIQSVQVLFTVMNVREHGPLFCTTLRFETSYEMSVVR